MPFRRPSALALLLAPLAACGEGAAEVGPPAPEWPAGTVLAVDGHPITDDEVDLEAETFRLIEPHTTDDHLRRLALARVVIPRAVAREIGREQRAPARAHAATQVELLRSGQGAPEEAAEVRGGPRQLGFTTWSRALELAPAEWSDPIEEPGYYRVVQLLEVEPAELPGDQILSVLAFDFPYLDTGGANLDQVLRDHRLTIVDPAWRTIVPEWIQFAMRAHGEAP